MKTKNKVGFTMGLLSLMSCGENQSVGYIQRIENPTTIERESGEIQIYANRGYKLEDSRGKVDLKKVFLNKTSLENQRPYAEIKRNSSGEILEAIFYGFEDLPKYSDMPLGPRGRF